MQYVLNLFSPYKGLPREIYVMFMARIINALGSFVMPLITIILKDSIGMSPQEAGLYISIAGIAFIPAALLGGKLADTIGRKVIIIIFETLAISLYILCGYIGPSMEMVYLLILAGAFMAAAGPAHDSLIADLTTPKNRTVAYSLTYMGWNLGFAVGPLIGGVLYEKHLPWVFYGDALTAFLAIILIVFFIKETIGRSREEITDEKRSLEKHEH